MALRPKKWFLYSPVAALPLIAAWALNTPAVVQGLETQAEQALKAAGSDWAKLAIDGRDARIEGDSPSQEQLDAAVKAVAGTYGVRLVEARARVVPVAPPVALAPPTINPIGAPALPLVISGTFPEEDTAKLTAGLAGKTWELGKDPALSSDGKGNWTFKPEIELAPGTYDLAIEVTGKNGSVVTDQTKNEIVILPPPPALPAAPTVSSIETNNPQPQITGTYPAAATKTLTVTAGNTAYVLGTAKELTAAGDNWTLVPSAPVADGSYDVSAEVVDTLGRTVKSETPGKIVIDTVAPAAPTVAPIDTTKSPLTVTGTWPGKDAFSLVARLADKVWSLGKDKAITTDGQGNWTFVPDVDLKPGTYPLTVEAADKAGNTAKATADIVVAESARPPAARMEPPTVIGATSLVARPVVKGTWSEAAAKALSVSVGGKTYVLGTDEGLKSDGIGNWSLAVEKPLADGTYDVVAESADAAGTTLKDTSKDELVIDAMGPATPQIKLYAGEATPTSIAGTYDSTNAKSLKVGIPAAGVSATLGTDAALAADKDAWTLALATPLKPGSYDVEVETADSQGRIARDQTHFEILVKEPAAPSPPPPPAAPELKGPTVNAYSGDPSPASITGTWDEGVATKLAVSIPAASVAAELGASDAIASDGKGNWTLTLPAVLNAGTYDVTASETAADGHIAVDGTAGEIVVKTSPPPPAPAVDCEAELAKVADANPILFGFNLSDVVPPYDAAVKAYADLLAGKDCAATQLLVMGHTDYKGGSLYNEALSLTRAQHVANILTGQGVDAVRITVSGKGKSDPVDPAHEAEARAKNRRVSITIVK